MKKLKVAAVSVGKQSSVLGLPNSILVVVGEAFRHLNDRVTFKVFDQVLDNNIYESLEWFSPDAVVIGTTTVSYSLALKCVLWSKDRGLEVLLGGHHFNLESIARMSLANHGATVCYGDGAITLVTWLKYLLGDIPLHDVPNIYYLLNGKITRTEKKEAVIGSLSYHNLPVEVFDPIPYWDFENGYRRAISPKVMSGCPKAEILESCQYCSWGSDYSVCSPVEFWKRMKELVKHTCSIKWDRGKNIRCYQSGPNFSIDLNFVKEIWNYWPRGIEKILHHRVYGSFVSVHAGKMLYDMGMRLVFTGADGKPNYTNEWSENHPLIRSLENCRKCGLLVDLSFVLGQRGQSWSDLYKWIKFKNELVREFPEVIQKIYAWPNIILPGSSDWFLMSQSDEFMFQTDEVDVLSIRNRFLEKHTKLCSNISGSEALEKLETLASEFEK